MLELIPSTAATATFALRVQSGSSSWAATQRGGRQIQVILVDRIAPGWTLRRPLSIWVEQTEDGDYLVSDETFYVYGEGATWADAQKDFIESLIEYFLLVSGYDDEPSRQLQAYLGQYLHQQ